MTIDSTGWTTIGTIAAGAGTVATLFIQNYFQYKQAQLQASKLDQIQQTATRTADTVNGHLGTALITGAVAARALAVSDPTRVNQDLAASASQAAADHLREAVEVEKHTPTKEQ